MQQAGSLRSPELRLYSVNIIPHERNDLRAQNTG